VIVLNVAAFGPSLIDPSTRRVPLPLDSLSLAHALVSTAWLLVFLVQVTLVATGRTAMHRRLGVGGVFLSVALIAVTWFMVVEGARRGFDLSGDLTPGGRLLDAGAFLSVANTLVTFASFVAAGVWYRRRADVHKRLMTLAMLNTTGAPVAHLIGHWAALHPLAALIAPGSSILLLSVLVIHDRLSEGRIHPVSLWGGVASFVWTLLFFVVIAPTALWGDFASWVVR
jgi:hypothetical protein